MRLKLLLSIAAAFSFLVIPGQSFAQQGPTITVDKTALENGGSVQVSGQAPPGTPVYVEVWSERQVRASFFDFKKDEKTGLVPYRLYLSEDIPAHYRIYLPADKADAVKALAAEGSGWAYSKALTAMGADAAYSAPAKVKIDSYQSSLFASIIGSRGDKLADLSAQDTRRRSMQLIKARFRSAGNLLAPKVVAKADGSFTVAVEIPKGSAPGAYNIVAVAGSGRSAPAKVDNAIAFPIIYLSEAGTSLNLVWPFLLALAVGVFGVLMGAGGGFILNPLLVSLWPLPHTIVAGTVMPTVLFSQASGIFSYSRIKFISWKLGVTLGLSMLAGGFIGPKLTEMITLDQFKFVFGWILLVLAGLMLWQTTPAYLRKNAKEQAILKEFKARAEQAAKEKQALAAQKTA